MHRRLFSAGLALCALAPSSHASSEDKADTPASIEIGSRIQVQQTGHRLLLFPKKPVSGDLLRADETSVTLTAKNGRSVTVARTEIRKTAISRGKHIRFWRPLVGATIGGVIALGVVSSGGAYCLGGDCRTTGHEKATWTAGGAAVGALIGLIPIEEWRKSDVPPAPSAASPSATTWSVSPILNPKGKSKGFQLNVSW